ncbi:MAG TPA: OmpA family protein [Rhodobacteraceae bacterium]|nr:OmpA family protein [Paracoccaceae bacterium]
MQNAHRTTRLPFLVALLAVTLPLSAQAAEVRLPDGATLTKEKLELEGSYEMPIGPWHEESAVPTEAIAGRVIRQAWRLGGTGMSSYQILLNLRQQIVDAGYEIVFECEDIACGGFDFRFGTEVIGEPHMHVDLGDFRFLSATMPDAPNEAVSLLVSRSTSAGFVQVIQVGKAQAPTATVEPKASTKAEPGTALPATLSDDIGTAMESVGRFILADLVFATGSSDLGPGDFTSLTELADYLKANPAKRVALVGHTDAEGSLGGNISLSKRRAASVMDRLVNDFGVNPGQLEAEGIGYLAPIASNQSDDGRTRNRRVEAILVSTE